MENTCNKKQLQDFIDKNVYCEKCSDTKGMEVTKVLTVIEWEKCDSRQLSSPLCVKVYCSQCKKTYNDLVIDNTDGSWG